MKRKERERLPDRAAGAFPTFLYKTLDELEGASSQHRDDHAADEAMRSKPLLTLSDVELDEALLMHVGLSWMHVLGLLRLRQDPLREGIVGSPGDLLRNALRQGRQAWGNLAEELEEIAAPLITTLPKDEDHAPLHEAWSRWMNG